jgi:hypothetical protein
MLRHRMLFLLFILSGSLCAQSPSPFYSTYSWEANPVIASDAGLDQSEGQIILKDLRVCEYVYEKSGNLVVYVTHHRRIRVFTDKGIEQNNKIYIPSGNVLEFMDIKARSISPSGKISNIEKSEIKDASDVENKGAFKMFAVQGIEKNSEIEYLYTYKRNGNYFGTEYLQSKVPRMNVELGIISPQNLQMDAKLYNLDATLIRDTLSGDRNHIAVKIASITPLKEEKYSMYDGNLGRMEYKLAYNFSKGKARILTYEKAADVYYQSIFTTSKKDISAVKSLLKKIKVTGTDDFSKARFMEGKLKTKIELVKSQGEELEDIPKITDNNKANETGMARLYVACLKELGIKAELVLTCDRSHGKFDPDFDTWNFLETFLIYIPSADAFMDPSNFVSRLGFVAPQYIGQKGLFVQEVDLGDVKSGIMKIKNIPCPPYTSSTNLLNAEVSFADDFSETTIKQSESYTGYNAYNIQPVIGFLTDVQKKEYVDQNAKLTGENTTIEDVNMKGTAEEDILVKPFVLECKLKSPVLLEKAGNKYLFKVGTLIGPQEEMYQEGTRKTSPEIYYTHSLLRKLILHVPAGYTCSNLEKLKFNQKFMSGSDVLCEFISDYVLDDHTLTISITEDYRTLIYPLDQFESFRSVINASADFNKVTILLEKTGQ